MDLLRKISSAAAAVLPFLAAGYQLLVAYDYRSRPWKAAGAVVSALILLWLGWMRWGK
jgi:hypothetical protein